MLSQPLDLRAAPTVAQQPVTQRAVRRAVFLAERRMSGLTDTDRWAVERALIEASRRVSREGTPVRYLRSTYVAAQHRWLGLFVSTTPEAVNRVFGIAQVPDGSVIELTDVVGDPSDPDITAPCPEWW
jgi:hypothetical protein